MLMDQQRDAAALEVFMQLTQEYPGLPDPYNNIALLHARAGRLEAARQALERRCATTRATARRAPTSAGCT